MTDNKNRISSDIRTVANKKHATIAMPGAVAFNFDRKGVITLSKGNVMADELFTAAIEGGAEDFQEEEDMYVITCSPTDLASVKEAVEKIGCKVDDDTIAMLPKSFIEVSEEVRQQNQALIDMLEEIDDVDAVYHNMKMD